MLRIIVQAVDIRFLDDIASVHHDHPIGQPRHHAQVVGDPDDGHTHLFPQADHQLDDLSLDGHIQSGGWLIGDQQARVAG
jgi:hypothetical protein